MFGSCCHIKHVDAWDCAIIHNKADNNPKAEPTRLRRSGRLLVSSEFSETLRATAIIFYF